MVAMARKDILLPSRRLSRSVGVEGGIQARERLSLPSRTSYLRRWASCPLWFRAGSRLPCSAPERADRTGARRACKTGRPARRPSSRRARNCARRQPSLAAAHEQVIGGAERREVRQKGVPSRPRGSGNRSGWRSAASLEMLVAVARRRIGGESSVRYGGGPLVVVCGRQLWPARLENVKHSLTRERRRMRGARTAV